MNLQSMCKELVEIERQDGAQLKSIKALVQPKLIFIADGRVPLEPGDVVVRKLPSGIVERMVITDPGFYASHGSIPAHYQARYEREGPQAHARRQAVSLGFDQLLHPLIQQAASHHYSSNDFRNAVLDAITAVFDKIRERTNLDLDGEALINQVFSLQRPLLLLSELDTQSGRNDQSGFADIFRGFYRGVRNPKAHSLNHTLDAVKAGQHLVLASMLMRRVLDATIPPQENVG